MKPIIPDYGPYKSAPPTAKALAIRDQLAESMAAAPKGSVERRAARSALVDHILAEGLPLEDFSTPSGRSFAVTDSVSRPRARSGREQEARRWLNGRNAESLAHKFMREGGGFPSDLFEPLSVKINVHTD